MNVRNRTLTAAIVAALALTAAGCSDRNGSGTASRNVDRTAAITPAPVTPTPDTSATPSGNPAAPGTMAAAPSTSSPAATDQATTDASANVNDSAITTRVKTAVTAEPGLQSTQIAIDTKDGVVTLSGTVDNEMMKQRAMQIAHQVGGVRSVVDNLEVKSG